MATIKFPVLMTIKENIVSLHHTTSKMLPTIIDELELFGKALLINKWKINQLIAKQMRFSELAFSLTRTCEESEKAGIEEKCEKAILDLMDEVEEEEEWRDIFLKRIEKV